MTGDIIRYAFSVGPRERLLERNGFRCRGCGKRSALVVHHRDRWQPGGFAGHIVHHCASAAIYASITRRD
jgi:hypothetical protein